MGDVTNLEEEKKKRSKKKKGDDGSDDDRMSQPEFFKQLAYKMDEHRLAPAAWPAFPARFYVTCDSVGRKSFLRQLAPGIVRYVSPDAITDEIFRYCMKQLHALPEAQINVRSAELARLGWAALTKPVTAQVRPLLELSAPGLAFARLPFDIEHDPLGAMPEPPPAFESFLLRCTQPEEFCAFLGSLLDPDADRQQYLYLHGPGNDGKGSFLRFLFKLAPEACQFLQPKTQNDRFWNSKLFGKRIVVFSDCEQPNYFSSPEFKALTGDDPIYVEEKNQPGFSAELACKFIVASNYPPSITGQNSDMRRIVYVQIQPVDSAQVEPFFERRLLSEAEAILRFCKWHYLRLTQGTGRPIPCAPPKALADDGDEEYLSIFERHFEIAEGHSVPAYTVQHFLRKLGYKSNREVGRIKECWGRVLGVKAGHSKDKTQRVYWGCKLHGLEGLLPSD